MKELMMELELRKDKINIFVGEGLACSNLDDYISLLYSTDEEIKKLHDFISEKIINYRVEKVVLVGESLKDVILLKFLENNYGYLDIENKLLNRKYTSYNINEGRPISKSKSIQEQIVENLEEEIKSLSKIIVNTRERGDFGTYKNLINSLKGVLELYNNETGKNNNIINTNIALNLNDLIKIDSNGNMKVTKGSVDGLPNIKEITENVLKELKDQLTKRGLAKQLDIDK